MSGPMFHNGQLLFVDGQLAMAQACCCEGGPCCDCPWLEDYYRYAIIDMLGLSRMRATFSGACSGYVILEPISSDQGNCWTWRGDDFSNVSGCTCNFFTLSPAIEFYCDPANTNLSDMCIDIFTDAECLALPTCGIFVDGECGPPFRLKKKYLATDGIAPGCSCAEGTELFIEITNEDPWP